MLLPSIRLVLPDFLLGRNTWIMDGDRERCEVGVEGILLKEELLA